jgi:hypothetical protein
MEDAPRDADAAPALAAAGHAAGVPVEHDEPEDRPDLAEHGERDAAGSDEEAEDAGLERDGEVLHGPLAGRPDLSQDAIADLRAQHKQLRAQQKRIRAEMKNKARKRQRVLARMRHLDTAAVLQVLIERGVQLGGRAPPPAPPVAAAAAGQAALIAGAAGAAAPARAPPARG